MILRGGIKRVGATCLMVLVCTISIAQVNSGKIVFERKTNLKKLFKDNEQIKNFNMDLDTRVEEFELYFNDTSSAFLPIEDDDSEIKGWGKYLTSHNVIYKNLNKEEKLVIMDMWGTEMIVRDSIQKRVWKITERKRKLGGYLCRRAIWEMNDSTRIYAWFSTDVVPSVGPEGFDGLPGAILGLATEDGTVIYFAKEVEQLRPPTEKMIKDTKGKDEYTVAELKEIIKEKMGRWVKPKDIDAMFSWL